MNKFNLIKTIQLVVFILMTIAILLVVFLNQDVYSMISSDPGVRALAIFLWVILGLSFVFLYYDFYSFTGIRRENAELDNAIYSDALTGIANRYSVDLYLGQFQNQPLPDDIGCVTIEMSNLVSINKEHGHEAGDGAIQDFSEIMRRASSGTCFIGRNGGNKFLAIFRDCTEEKLGQYIQKIRELVEEHNQKSEVSLEYVLGSAFREGEQVRTLTELVALSDRRAAKKDTSAGAGA